MTDQDELLALANATFTEWMDGPGFGPAISSTEKYKVTEVETTYDGHGVRLTFTDSDSNPPAYRYNVIVHELTTGKQIATGNGSRTWKEAFEIVHWGELRSFNWTD